MVKTFEKAKSCVSQGLLRGALGYFIIPGIGGFYLSY